VVISAYAGGEDCGANGAHKIKIVKQIELGDGQSGGGGVTETDPVMVWVSADADGHGAADGRSEKRVIKIKRAPTDDNDADAAQKGWLGVAIGEITEARSDGSGEESEGIRVLEVIADGPAQKAGVLANDVIVAVNGEEVGTKLGEAVDIIKARKPGETINLTVLRDGKEMTLRATLGSRADIPNSAFAWKFNADSDASFEDDVQVRGKMMMRGPSGKWVMKDLGDLAELKDLPADVKAVIPKSGSRSIQVIAGAGDGDKNLKLKIQRDGNTLTLDQEGEGPITVTRENAAGQVTTNTYQTADELRAADEEAFDLYDQAQSGMVFQFDGDAGEVDFDFDVEFDFDSEEWQQHMADLHKNLQESLQGSREAYEEHMEKARELMAKLHGQGGDGAELPLFLHHMGQVGKPKHTFEVRADGTIEVKIRKGDSELVQLYRNENDLKARDPQMFEKYDELMSEDAD